MQVVHCRYAARLSSICLSVLSQPRKHEHLLLCYRSQKSRSVTSDAGHCCDLYTIALMPSTRPANIASTALLNANALCEVSTSTVCRTAFRVSGTKLVESFIPSRQAVTSVLKASPTLAARRNKVCSLLSTWVFLPSSSYCGIDDTLPCTRECRIVLPSSSRRCATGFWPRDFNTGALLSISAVRSSALPLYYGG